MEKLLKEKIVMLILPIIAIAAVVYFLTSFEATSYQSVTNKLNEIADKKNKLNLGTDRLEQLKKQKAAEAPAETKKNEPRSGKVIYEVPGQQFSPEASFGVIFENMLANLTNSGVRIRSIEYNYQPVDDKITGAGIGGYNACEISFVSVGSYAQFQNFFKNITKEKYLTNLYEIYIEPYDKDKTILITRFKIRLYTKTI